ncbi:MAG: S9 family peptidase [Bacteroidia bacterium]
MNRSWIILLVLLIAVNPARAQKKKKDNANENGEKKELTLQDIWASGKFYPKGMTGIRPLNDGKHFARLHNDFSSGSSSLLRYQYDGDKVDTLFTTGWLTGTVADIIFDDLALSESEKTVILETGTVPLYRHSSKAMYYLWNKDNRLAKPIMEEELVMYPNLSAPEDKVAFVKDNNLYVQNLADDKVTQITKDGEINKIINGASDWVYEEEFKLVQAYEWNPEGTRIAYYKFDEREVQEYMLKKYTNSAYPESYRYKYPKVGAVNSKVSIWIYDLKTGKNTQVALGDEYEYIPRIKWTREPDVLSIQLMNRHQNKQELVFANAVTGTSEVVLTEQSDTYIDITDDLTFLPENDFLWTSDLSGYNHIYLYDNEGNLERQITSGEWDVTEFLGYAENDKTLYYASAEESPLERYIYSVKLNGKGPKKMTHKKGWNDVSFSKTFDYMIHNWSEATEPPVVAIRKSGGAMVKEVEANNELREVLSEYDLPEKEFFSFKGPDGTLLNGWMIKPADFKEKNKYPVLMTVYGGPGSQTVENQWSSYNEMWFQYMVSKGYIVVSVDNRGTGARGSNFKKMTYLNLGKYEVEDQMAAAEYLGNLEYVDASRIGIFGWSYGGYMASLCIMKGNELFKTAVAVAPVSDWRFYDNIYTERFMRTPEENPEGYKESSVLTYVDQLKGNYLIVHGTFDDNVHPQNSLELIKQLIARNKKFDSEFYPDKNHGIYGGYTRLHLFTKITDYLLSNL